MRPHGTPEAHLTQRADLPPTPGAWQVAAASVRGTGHEKTGQPCQDAHAWRCLPDGILLGAVADGAGSAALGEVGANLAARTAIEALCRQHGTSSWPASDEAWQALLTEALRTARAAIEAEASARGVPLRDLATTLILVVATPHLVAVRHVGDGAAVVGDGTGTCTA